MKISACMIAKNEEKNIETCINSYKNIVDEIIVVDTGSSDRTIEIAENLDAKVYFFEWINDFAAAKNFALSKAKGDWIIFLDADEYFDEASAKKIRNIILSLKNSKYTAIGCKLTNIDKVTNKLIDSFMQVRIFKNDKNIRYESSIHEGLRNKKGKIKLISFYDELNIYHTGYSANINKIKSKRNLEIILEKIKSEGENPDYYRYLCDCYFSLEDYENALRYGGLHLKSGIKIIGYQSRIYKVIIDCLWKMGKPKNQIEMKLIEAISIFPDHPNFYCSYALFLLDEKRYDEALKNFLLTLKYNDEYKGIEVNLILGIIPVVYKKVAYIYILKNKEELALEYLYKALQFNKFDVESFGNIFNIIKKEKSNTIIEFLNNIYDIQSEEDTKFLVNQFIKIKPKDVLAYYTNIWYKKFRNEDSSLSFTLLVQGRYKTVSQLYYKAYLNDFSDTNALLSIIASMLDGDASQLKLLSEVVKPTYRRIILAYIEDKHMLYDVDIDDYLRIFEELILIDKKDTIQLFIGLSSRFSINISNKIAELFKSNHKYKEALTYFDNCSKKDKSILMNIGYCNYKIMNYEKAKMEINQAIYYGYSGNDAKEFLKWIDEYSILGETKENI